MRITEIKGETLRGFRASAAGLSPALGGKSKNPRGASFSLGRGEQRRIFPRGAEKLRPLARLDSIKAGSVVAASSRVVRKSCVAQIFSVAAARAETIRGECFPLCGNPRKRPAARRAGVLVSAFVLAACAPTIHLDAPAMPAMDPQRGTYCTFTEKAPLDPAPQLPDVGELSPCPPGSGFVACFTLDQDLVRQRRFKMLHDDRDYCRDAYDRSVTRGDGGATK